MSLSILLRITKVKLILLAVIGSGILISGSLASNGVYCFTAPCPQETSTTIGRIFYPILTFNELFLTSELLLKIRNLLQPIFPFYANSIMSIVDFILNIIVWYLLLSLLLVFMQISKKNKR